MYDTDSITVKLLKSKIRERQEGPLKYREIFK